MIFPYSLIPHPQCITQKVVYPSTSLAMMSYRLWAWEHDDYELQPNLSTRHPLSPSDGSSPPNRSYCHKAFNSERSQERISPQLSFQEALNVIQASARRNSIPYVNIEHLTKDHVTHVDSNSQDNVSETVDLPEENIVRYRNGSPRSSNSPSTRTKYATFGTFVVLLLACSIVACTIIYATPTSTTGKILATSSSRSLLILRVLSEICTIILWVLILWSTEDLQWALASRPTGIGLLGFLSLDAGTRVWGLLRLFCMSGGSNGPHKRYSLIRLCLLVVIPLPGIVIMSSLSIKPFFSTQDSYNVAAGLADFNSTTAELLSQQAAMAFMFDISYPLWDSRITFPMDPLGRDSGRCRSVNNPTQWSACEESILMTGGCLTISPQKDDLTKHREASIYVVEKTKGYHVEFDRVYNQSTLFQGICKIHGYEMGAVQWCVALGNFQEILHGYNVCPLNLMARNLCLTNTSWINKPFKFSSSFYVYRRTSTVYYSRNNLSIIAITDLSPPIPAAITAEEVASALNVIMRSINFRQRANSTDERASDLAVLMAGGLQQGNNPFVRKTALQESRKALAMLLHYFQANGIGAGDPQSIWETTTPRLGLPLDMYTMLQIAVPSYHVSASQLSLYVFVGVASSLLLLCFTTAVFTCGTVTRWPWKTGFPSLDFAIYSLPLRGGQQKSLCESLGSIREKRGEV